MNEYRMTATEIVLRQRIREMEYEHRREIHKLLERKELEFRDLRRTIEVLMNQLCQNVAMKVNPPVFVAPASVFRPFVERIVEDYDADDWVVSDWIVEARDLLKRHPNAL